MKPPMYTSIQSHLFMAVLIYIEIILRAYITGNFIIRNNYFFYKIQNA